jgi:hypothetical protein
VTRASFGSSSGFVGFADLSPDDPLMVPSFDPQSPNKADRGDYSLPFTHVNFGAAGGTGLVGGFDVILNISNPRSPELRGVFLFGGVGVGATGHFGVQAVMGGTIGSGHPATLGFGSMLSGGLFGVGFNMDTRIGLSSPSLEVTPSGGIVFGGFACFCVSVAIGRGPLLQAMKSFQRGAAAVFKTGSSPFFAQAP